MTREVMPPVADNKRQTVQVFQNKNASISVYGSLLPKNFARRPRLLRRVSTPLKSRDRRTHSGPRVRATPRHRHSRTAVPLPHPGARGTPRDHLPLAYDRGTATGSG
jgi:hypothetical protein